MQCPNEREGADSLAALSFRVRDRHRHRNVHLLVPFYFPSARHDPQAVWDCWQLLLRVLDRMLLPAVRGPAELSRTCRDERSPRWVLRCRTAAFEPRGRRGNALRRSNFPCASHQLRWILLHSCHERSNRGNEPLEGNVCVRVCSGQRALGGLDTSTFLHRRHLFLPAMFSPRSLAAQLPPANVLHLSVKSISLFTTTSSRCYSSLSSCVRRPTPSSLTSCFEHDRLKASSAALSTVCHPHFARASEGESEQSIRSCPASLFPRSSQRCGCVRAREGTLLSPSHFIAKLLPRTTVLRKHPHPHPSPPLTTTTSLFTDEPKQGAELPRVQRRAAREGGLRFTGLWA